MSVLLPVGGEPLIHRWEQRRNCRATIRWIAHLVLPYALYYVADPTGGIERRFFWRHVPRGHRSDIEPRQSQFRPHRHRGGRLGPLRPLWRCCSSRDAALRSRRLAPVPKELPCPVNTYVYHS